MPEATAFWTKLAAELRSNPSAPTEAAFFPGLSKAHLRSVLKDSYNRSKIGIAAQSMYGRLKRHLPTNATLANDLFLLVKDAFLTTSQAFEATANAVYPHEKLGITLAEINAIFDRILPPGTLLRTAFTRCSSIFAPRSFVLYYSPYFPRRLSLPFFVRRRRRQLRSRLAAGALRGDGHDRGVRLALARPLREPADAGLHDAPARRSHGRSNCLP
jgi:hypothetical protein